ncbi:hypothetical protein DXG03_009081 [Asterophora parasitica]|uniref:3beta-hydroxysteroid 3-dehydrogenase n=1 Tax=Asterophora parasitica TaxID=117018 RepID=A0A9P7G742_9AGAR|nr:hypothetical protein DXG03_009081 [Asterophora parasitica]
MPGGTVVLTGANSTLGLAFIANALQDFPTHHFILTVRNPSPIDPNTAKLHLLLSKFPSAKYTLHTLNLASLAGVRTFSSFIASQVARGDLPPISAIVCNAFAWSISSGLQFTRDGFELSFQVNHLAHFALVLQLLDSMHKTQGRIVGLSSDSHEPGASALAVYPPGIPDDIERLARPVPDKPGEEVGRGFQRYGVSKLCVVMFVYELNRRLQADSRAMSKDVPKAWGILMKYFLNPLQPLLKLAIPTLRNSNVAGKDLVELSLREAFAAARGTNGYYYKMSRPGKSSTKSYAETKWAKLWERSVAWSGIQPGDTALSVA